MDIFLSLSTLGAVLVQGGYFPTIFLMAALAMSVMLLSVKKPVIPRGAGWSLALAGWYLLAALRGGYRADTLSQAFLPMGCALFLVLYCGLPKEKKQRCLSILMMGSGILAGVSILAYSGVLPLEAAVTSRRLQGTFQYANAAGSWFAAMAVLTQDSENPRCRKFNLSILTALLLTRSTGALGLYALTQGARAVLRRREGEWANIVLLNTAALPFALFFYLVPGWPALPALALLYLLGWYLERLLPKARQLRLEWACLFFGGGAAVAFLAGRRFASSLGTFAERLVHMKDGFGAILLHPVFGLGAGCWAEAAPYYQSAQYSATVIHSSPVLIGVDAGVPAMLLALGLIVCGWRRGGRTLGQTLAVLLLVLHSVFDFTVCFYPLAVLVLALLFVGGETVQNSGPDKGRRKAAVWRTGAVVCVVLSAWLLAGELETKRLNTCINAQDWTGAVSCYEHRQMLFGESQKARSAYVYALTSRGDMEGVLRATENTAFPPLHELLSRAQALNAVGDRDAACGLLLEQLERRRYQTELFQRTAELLRRWEADADTVSAYNRIVDLANGGRTLLGDLMGNQVYIEKIKQMEGVS